MWLIYASLRPLITALVLIAAGCGGGETTPEIQPTNQRYIVTGNANKGVVVMLSAMADSAVARYATVISDLNTAGYAVVAFDLPCHGEDVPPESRTLPKGIVCWRDRLNAGDNFFPAFALQVSNVITALRPGEVWLIGESRGAYAGIAVAASDPRISKIAAMAPVTDLRALVEFQGATVAPDLSAYESAVAGRAILVAINEDDQRVSTDAAIRFAKSVNAHLELFPGSGHVAFDVSAAEWLLH